MMDYEMMSYMMGRGSGGMHYGFFFFGWLFYILLITLMVLSVLSLIKFINKR